MRRLLVLLAFAPLACGEEDEPNDFVAQKTIIQVSPPSFLGDLPCSENGGMERYQATLWDITEGVEEAFELPHSKVEPCTSAMNFEYIKPNRRYIGKVVGFDRIDIQAQNLGSPVVVDEEGKSVSPRWSTTCWGYDGYTPSELGMGGAPSEDKENTGGAGGEFLFGLVVFEATKITMRGCDPLKDHGENGPTAVSFELENALTGLTCGEDAGQVEWFTVTPLDLDNGAGGAGGASRAEDGAACDESLILEDLPAGQFIRFEALAYEADQTQATWSSSCEARTVQGVTVQAGCGPLSPL